MTGKPVKSVLFVCLGNICRSPLAEGVFASVLSGRGAAHRFVIDSAGTGGWHAGHPPDRRSIEVAAKNGINISHLRARKVTGDDFMQFDLIVGMDRANVADLHAMKPSGSSATIALFHDYAAGRNEDVPDPYYGDLADFEAVYQSVRASAERLADRLGA